LNGTLKLLAYSDDVNILGINISTIKKTTEALLEANKGFGIEVNADVCVCLVTRMQDKIII